MTTNEIELITTKTNHILLAIMATLTMVSADCHKYVSDANMAVKEVNSLIIADGEAKDMKVAIGKALPSIDLVVTTCKKTHPNFLAPKLLGMTADSYNLILAKIYLESK